MINEITFDVDLVSDDTNIHHFDVVLPDQIARVDLGQTEPLSVQFLGQDVIIAAFDVQEGIGPPGPQGPQGIPGPPGQGFEVKGELPIGVIDGVNKTFTTMLDFMDNSLCVFLNGLRQAQSNDYTVPGPNSFHMNDSPLVGDTLIVDYLVQG